MLRISKLLIVGSIYLSERKYARGIDSFEHSQLDDYLVQAKAFTPLIGVPIWNWAK